MLAQATAKCCVKSLASIYKFAFPIEDIHTFHWRGNFLGERVRRTSFQFFYYLGAYSLIYLKNKPVLITQSSYLLRNKDNRESLVSDPSAKGKATACRFQC